MSEMKTVSVPRELLIRALINAPILYIGEIARDSHDPGSDDECWAEFDRLAEYVGTVAELMAGLEAEEEFALVT